MKMLFLVAAVLACCTAFADGQTGGVRTVVFNADSQQRVGGVIQARGHVRIFHGSAMITADEADFTDGGPDGPVDIQLRGSVLVHVAVAK
jgi:hypothetical protein